MKEKAFKALKIVSESEDISIRVLRDNFVKKHGEDSFDPRIISDLTAGEEPSCTLRGGHLQITEKGKEMVASEPESFTPEDDFELEDEPQEKEKEPKKPEPPKRKTPETVGTDFVESSQEIAKVVYGIRNKKNILLNGPTGCGKSFLVEELARVEGKKLWTVNCDVELDKTELVGHYEAIANEGLSVTEWIKGIITLAMENGDWLVLDEVNMARPEVLSVLHQVLDHRKTLTVKEHGCEEIKPHEDFRVFATMNPDYAGTAELNAAFRRRFEVILDMDYLTPARERKLIMDRTGVELDNAEKLVSIGVDTRKLQKEGKINTPVSTAHLLEFAYLLKEGIFDPLECAKITLNISDDGDEKQDVLNVVKSYF